VHHACKKNVSGKIPKYKELLIEAQNILINSNLYYGVDIYKVNGLRGAILNQKSNLEYWLSENDILSSQNCYNNLKKSIHKLKLIL